MSTTSATSAAPSSVPSKTKGNVDAAIRTILTHNFDTDSTVCLTTLIKVLDNILHKPQNEKVRCLRTGNATIQSKIIDKHGHNVLLVCGFVLETKSNSFSEEERFVLYEHNEETAFLVNVRHTLAKTLVQDLQVSPEKVPPFRPPLPKLSISQTATTTNTGFDVYSGQRFDGQAAAVGANLGPPAGWKSNTETELAHLQRREAQITQQLATKKKTSQNTTSSVVDRHWTVVTPGQQQQPPRQSTSSSSSSTNKDDKQLLAKHYQEQYKKKMALEQSGFTTKAMRDLAKLKKQNVYSHTQLAIAFPDGLVIKANFGTKETVSTVMEGLRAEVFVEHAPIPKLELYQTPPRIVLDPHKTLTELGLVPAAKIYVRWKSPLVVPPCSSTGRQGWYVRARFFDTEQPQHPVRAIAVPVVGGGNTTAEGKPSSTGMMRDDNNKPQKKKKTQEEKAAEMMKRMLGKR